MRKLLEKSLSILLSVILPVLLVTLTVLISVHNIKIYKQEFLKLNYAQGAALVVSILIVYYANQLFASKRKIKENIEKISYDIQKYTDDSRYCDFSLNNGDRIIEYLIMQKKIKNYIFILKKYSVKEKIDEHVEYIEQEFNIYNEIVSEHQNDIDYLCKSKNTLINKLQNISTKCNLMISELYC